MKKLLLLTFITIYSCGGPTINLDDDREYIDIDNKNKIISYKGTPFTGTVERYLSDNVKLIQQFFVEDGKVYQEKSYYENGQLEYEENYTRNTNKGSGVEKDGEQFYYFENGELKNKSIYKDGKEIKQ